MDKLEFEMQFNRLEDQYGRHSYSDERKVLFYQKLKHIPNYIFEIIIARLLMSCRSAPLDKEFFEMMCAFNQLPHKVTSEKKQFVQPCGHSVFTGSDGKQAPYCPECIKQGDLNEISKNPYQTDLIPSELLEWSSQFKRLEWEDFTQYQRRTMPLFRDVIALSKHRLVKNVIGDQPKRLASTNTIVNPQESRSLHNAKGITF